MTTALHSLTVAESHLKLHQLRCESEFGISQITGYIKALEFKFSKNGLLA
jgi:hypothetical protein